MTVKKNDSPIAFQRVLVFNYNFSSYLLAQIRFDTAENGSSKVWVIGIPAYLYTGKGNARTGEAEAEVVQLGRVVPCHRQSTAPIRRSARDRQT